LTKARDLPTLRLQHIRTSLGRNLPGAGRQLSQPLAGSPRPARGWAEYYADAGDIFLRIGNLTRETIELDLSDVQHVALPNGAAEGRRTRIREGDMLVSITADLGSIAVAPKLDKPAYVNQHIALCRPKDSVHPRWLGYAMLSRQSKRQMMNSGYGGTKIQLSLEDVRHVWLAVPPLDVQREIAIFLDQRLDKIARQIALIDQLDGWPGNSARPSSTRPSPARLTYQPTSHLDQHWRPKSTIRTPSRRTYCTHSRLPLLSTAYQGEHHACPCRQR